jgi:CheY-like chemotaxis protein
MTSVLDGVTLLWFLLAALSLLFVAIDNRTTPESVVMKWGFVLLTAYTGVVGAFLYVLGCREPLPGLHERYVAARWRQALGSAMHCVAGDGVGILAGAVLSSVLHLSGVVEMILEYIVGFAFGWTIFQALFMRDMAGGSYSRALVSTFVPEVYTEQRRLIMVVVDDDSLVLTNMAAMLDDLGHKVFEASSARQALDILRQESGVQLVVTDLAMPGMTGLQLIQEIKDTWPNVPVILATGFAELPPGVDPRQVTLAKPFLQQDLARAVEIAMTAPDARRVLSFRGTRR